MRATIHNYFVPILVETEKEELLKAISIVGIELGLKEFAVLSDSTVYHNPKYSRSLEKKLVKERRM